MHGTGSRAPEEKEDMDTKSGLLMLLQATENGCVSGEDAAKRLGVSRAAVWKAAEALRLQGMGLESVPGRGYRLADTNDVLSREALQACLGYAAAPLRFVEQVDSTNLLAKRWVIDGAPHGAMVVAARQTAGRGRLGRQFASPPGGLYLSVVLRPRHDAGTAVLVTAAAAVAVCRAVAALFGRQLAIKWVNDLYDTNKKCCGILTEAGTNMENGQIEYLVVGIGINVTTPHSAFPPEVQKVAGSLCPGGPAPATRAQLAAAIHSQLLAEYEALPDKAFLQEYRRRSMVLGRTVTVLAEPAYEALAVAIDDEARLVVKRPDGWTHALSYGEISVRV